MKISEEAFELANARGAKKKASHPGIVSVRYDRDIARLVIELDSGVGISIPSRELHGLEQATPVDLQNAEISPSGLGVHFPRLDVDLYLPAVLEDFLGTRRWMATSNGKLGGKATSVAKAAAARENGKLGGRPRKSAQDEQSVPGFRKKTHD